MDMYATLVRMLMIELQQNQFAPHVNKLLPAEQETFKCWQMDMGLTDKEERAAMACILVKLHTFRTCCTFSNGIFCPDNVFGKDIHQYGLDQIKYCVEHGISLCLPNTTSAQLRMIMAAMFAYIQFFGWTDNRRWLKEPVVYRPYVFGNGIMTQVDLIQANMRHLSLEDTGLAGTDYEGYINPPSMLEPLSHDLLPILAFQMSLYGCYTQADLKHFGLENAHVVDLWTWVASQRGALPPR